MVVYAAPKNYSDKKLAERARIETKKEADNRLVEIKKGLKPDVGAKLAQLEKNYAEARQPRTKDSRTGFSFCLLGPPNVSGASVLYIEEKAALLNKADQWIVAGDRYLSMAEFGEPDGKTYRLDKAAECYQNALDVEPET